jgi:hypothetical protein
MSEKEPCTIFVAGVIQGSCKGTDICDQGYRGKLTTLLRKALPEAKVFCGVEEYPGSPFYDDEKAKNALFDLISRAENADVVVAYLPQASLGTAIEMWQAHRAKRKIFTISPMTENWVIKFLASRNFTSLEAFEEFVTTGEFGKTINA